MRLFELSIGTVVLRFYLMMAFVIVGVLTKLWFLAVFALPIFLSILMGATFGKKEQPKMVIHETKNRSMAQGQDVAA